MTDLVHPAHQSDSHSLPLRQLPTIEVCAFRKKQAMLWEFGSKNLDHMRLTALRRKESFHTQKTITTQSDSVTGPATPQTSLQRASSIQEASCSSSQTSCMNTQSRAKQRPSAAKRNAQSPPNNDQGTPAS